MWPFHGAGVQMALEPGWLACSTSDVALASSSWPEPGDMVCCEDRLPPDLLRAAPETYGSARSSGFSIARDWIQQLYAGAKDESGPKSTDLCNAATEGDFAVARRTSAAESNQLLVSSDGIEIKWRRMAAVEHRDLVGAYLVPEVMQFSMVEHQRQERGMMSGRGGRRGGRAAGHSNQQQAPPGDQAGGAGERCRGGLGGRGGRT